MICNEILFGKWEDHIGRIDDSSVDLVVTDPPYQVTPHPWDLRPDWGRFMKEMGRVCGNHGQMWIFCRMPWAVDLHLAAVKYGWVFSQERVWQKQNGSGATVQTFRKVHENIWHYKRPKATTFNLNDVREPKTSTGDKSIKAGKGYAAVQFMKKRVAYVDDGMRLPKSVIFCPNLHQSRESLGHSTQKPMAIIKPLIVYSSNPGDLVLDPFCGTGTTPLAAKEAGRRWLAIEMTEKWHEVASGRLVDAPRPAVSGGAVKGTGDLFDEQ